MSEIENAVRHRELRRDSCREPMNHYQNESFGLITIFKRASRINWILAVLGILLSLTALVIIDSDFLIRGTGTLSHSESVPVYSERGGIIAEILFDEGDYVEKGQIVLALENPEHEAALLDIETDLANAEREIEQAELALKEWKVRPGEDDLLTASSRLERLREIIAARESAVALFKEALDNELVSVVQLRREEIALLEARQNQVELEFLADLEKAGAAEFSREREELRRANAAKLQQLIAEKKELLEKERRRREIRSPVAGHLAHLAFRYPHMAVAPGEFVFEVVNEDSPFEVDALVGERNFDLLRVGGEVRMNSAVVGNLMGDTIIGHISELPIEPEPGDTGQVTYEVEIAVDESPIPLVPGSSVEVEFVLGRRTLFDAILDALSGSNARRRLDEENSNKEAQP